MCAQRMAEDSFENCDPYDGRCGADAYIKHSTVTRHDPDAGHNQQACVQTSNMNNSRISRLQNPMTTLNMTIAKNSTWDVLVFSQENQDE